MTVLAVTLCQYEMKGACAGHVQRTALVDGARIGAQNAILCWCNTTLGINLRVHGAHNVKYKYPSGARKSNIPYWTLWLNLGHLPPYLLNGPSSRKRTSKFEFYAPKLTKMTWSRKLPRLHYPPPPFCYRIITFLQAHIQK